MVVVVVAVVVVKLEHNTIAPYKQPGPDLRAKSIMPVCSKTLQKLRPFSAPAPEDQIDPRLHTFPVAVVVSLTKASMADGLEGST